jgi:hypothetical protein
LGLDIKRSDFVVAGARTAGEAGICGGQPGHFHLWRHVEWSLNARPPTVRYRVADPTPYGKIVYGRRDVRDQVTGDWPPIPLSIRVKAGLT